MALEILNGPIIAAGEALSDGVDCSAGSIIRLTMPPEWDAANISFQISSDGAFYNDLVKGRPCENFLKAIAFLKIRSGSRDAPVTQSEQRAFAIAIEPDPVSGTR
ncbi:hypothetical protein NLM33_13690 [Bradyrhizobium sp. CCGUVB1N3]|uniref:hypothetical protein n=1 Tax=Bradyrhizobium sp. CCGUVB1N3 TaxID=2949629 RepID=UPI0020B3D15D|nr:hypothetical protein [Bradyrhizobium sp. CCGUVB1N3]MCP3471384.1 hypothetical protein [Bradyrhizobium sp. CCGUVB1N3]